MLEVWGGGRSSRAFLRRGAAGRGLHGIDEPLNKSHFMAGTGSHAKLDRGNGENEGGA
ncbi:MAG: hypothetical protein JJT88_05380 [Gammaproteobacteria bacterium]|nr:hypothetical protein [Gammaproteobacteria bacterium]